MRKTFDGLFLALIGVKGIKFDARKLPVTTDSFWPLVVGYDRPYSCWIFYI